MIRRPRRRKIRRVMLLNIIHFRVGPGPKAVNGWGRPVLLPLTLFYFLLLTIKFVRPSVPTGVI